LLVLAACPPSAPSGATPTPTPASDDEAIAKAGKDYLALLEAHSPEHATALGLHGHDSELDDRSLAAFEKSIADEEAMLARLKRELAHPHASRAARTDLAILLHSLEVDIRSKRDLRPLERNPTLYTSPMYAFFLMMARDYAPAGERAKNALFRIEKIPAVVAAAKVNMKNPPRVWTQVAIEMASAAALFFDDQRAPLSAALPAEAVRIDAAIHTAKTAYAEYRGFLEKTLLPRSNGDYAAGRALFDYLLHQDYFLDEGADAVLALGKRIFAETEAQMDAIAHRIDPSAKGWPEVARRVKAKHPSAAELLPTYRDEVARARGFLVAKDAVPFPPGDECEVIDTPPFQRSTITAAYDEPPPLDKTTRGLFFVTPVDPSLSPEKQEEMLRENDHADQVDTVVHETYPGHHLQLSFARLHPSLMRKITDAAIFSEGWGLYSEELMAELGYYTDEERLMQLEWTLVRAARIVLDVGLHTQGMSFDDAMAMLTDRVHLEHELALSEVKRYTLRPTQPLSYLVGREMIFKMRERYKARDPPGYTLKKFHAEILSHGSIAPGLIAREIFD
jgi:uncharacterized protein (DUF885 family)